jgi:hypothetical protein
MFTKVTGIEISLISCVSLKNSAFFQALKIIGFKVELKVDKAFMSLHN